MKKPSLWMPEPNVALHQAIGKLAEEAGELATIAARCLIQGVDQCEPVTGKPNLTALLQEMADVIAILNVVHEELGDRLTEELDDEMDERITRKIAHKKEWLEAIR